MGCFIDTTLVVASAQKDDRWTPISESYAKSNAPGEVPQYAQRELLASVIQILCNTHNRIRDSQNIAQALLAVIQLPAISGRMKEGQLQAIAISLRKALSEHGNPNEPMSVSTSRAACQQLALLAERSWRRGRNLPSFMSVQPLGCFTGNDLTLDAAGFLKGPSGRFGCNPKVRCSAALYLHGKIDQVEKLVKFLRPTKEAKKGGEKRETTRRRAALKDLVQNGPDKFNKNNCRALGDAYFAVMCPPGSHVITTNIVDHIPLCEALGKEALNPIP